MGAKAPSKLKLRRPTYKCQSCSKKFLSTQALKSHQYCVHKIKENSKPGRQKGKLTNLLGKALKSRQKSSPMRDDDSKEADSKSNLANVDNAAPPTARKIEFECPQCLKIFTVYFSAFKHIQKFHCINEEGQKVDPDSPDLIKPVRVEFCTKCNCRVRVTELHMCTETAVDSNLVALACVCSGCNQQFATIQLFDLHVTGLHCDGIESMFFPTMNDFLKWKADMESETSTKYLILNKCTSRQTLRCTFFLSSHYPHKEEDIGYSRLCPSSIVLREYSKGIQVHFYKQHHGHPSPEYVISEKYSKFTITSLMYRDTNSELAGIDMTDDTDLYVQFKTLMDNIVLDAAKLKINHLKILIGKSLEMSTILKQYSGDEDSDDIQRLVHVNKSLTDDDITVALESVNKDFKRKKDPIVYMNKNKSGSSASNLKRLKLEINENRKDVPTATMKFKESITATVPMKTYKNNNRIKTPTILNTFSLAEEETDKNILTRSKAQIQTDVTEAHKNNNSPRVNQIVISPTTISSFNDSYREFVDKNFVSTKKEKPNVANTSNVNSKIKVLSKNDINEKHEQNISMGNTNDILIAKSKTVNKNNSINNNTKTIDNGKKHENSMNKKLNNSISKKLDGNKAIHKTNNVNKETNKKANAITKIKVNSSQKATANNKGKVDVKKKIMKTKIGQFKPSLSPKKTEANTSLNSSCLNNSTSKLKPDFEYEVKEQENDCNILILKI